MRYSWVNKQTFLILEKWGKLSSLPQHPKEHCNAIITMSGKQLGEYVGKIENEVNEDK